MRFVQGRPAGSRYSLRHLFYSSKHAMFYDHLHTDAHAARRFKAIYLPGSYASPQQLPLQSEHTDADSAAHRHRDFQHRPGAPPAVRTMGVPRGAICDRGLPALRSIFPISMQLRKATTRCLAPLRNAATATSRALRSSRRAWAFRPASSSRAGFQTTGRLTWRLLIIPSRPIGFGRSRATRRRRA